MLYAIFPLSEADLHAALDSSDDSLDLPERVKAAVGKVYDKYAPMAWFVDYEGTTDDLVDLIWPDEQKAEACAFVDGIVVSAGGLAGYASNDLWEWLRINRGK